jgi:signal-transduction protein with cAMP-binding, CBS, and nucleotidyltransferase domain
MQNPLNNVGDVLELKANNSVIRTVAPDILVFDTVRMMNQHKIGSVVVIENGRVVGIFTERDVLMRIVAADRNPHSTRVDQVMTGDPICVTRSMLAKDVMANAMQKRCRHFPMIEDGQLIGLISIGDLMHLASRDQADRIDAGILAMKAVSGR